MFADLYLQSVDIFFRYLQHHYRIDTATIQDIIGDYFIKLRDALTDYNPKRSLHAYMRTIFKNNLKDYFKKHKMTHFGRLEDENAHSFEETLEDEATSLRSFLQQSFQHEVIQKEIEQLDGESKDIIHFKFVEQYTYKEIAKILGIKEANVRQKTKRIIKKLSTKLHHYGDTTNT